MYKNTKPRGAVPADALFSSPVLFCWIGFTSLPLLPTGKPIDFEGHLHSRAAVVPLHTQRFAAIGRLQQLELEQDGLVQVSAHKGLIVEDGDAHNWGVHDWMPGKPEGEKQQNDSTLVGEKVERDVQSAWDEQRRTKLF